MAHTMPETWQEMLEILTVTAKHDGFYKSIIIVSEREYAVKKCMSHSFYRKKLSEWISFLTSKAVYRKSTCHSSKLRADGIQYFKKKDYVSCLQLFTESIAYAPYETKEMALAVANRSAVLFNLKIYEECLKDVELALSNNYPEELKYKLINRKAECLAKLNRHIEAIDSYNYALELLKVAHLDNIEEKELQILTNKFMSQKILNDPGYVKPSDKISDNDFNQEKVPNDLPDISHGENENFAYASTALNLSCSPSKGRHVKAKKNVKAGDIIFVEKPYTFVLLPDYYKQYCHNCCKKSMTLIPCNGCTRTFYCGVLCRDTSWTEYHKYECTGGIALLQSVGIAHLALRVVLKADPLHSENKRFRICQPDECLKVEKFGDKKNNYPAVYSLLPHTDKMEGDDFFHYALTAALLLIYLKEYTNFFQKTPVDNKDRNIGTELGTLNISDDTEENINFVGHLILRHIAQLICNAHAITKIESIPMGHNVTEESQVRIATAIYPSVSMMNHSCDPNIISSFCDQYVVIRAIRGIAEGTEVLNCYGPHCKRMAREERQEALLSQYFFKCICDFCSNPDVITRMKFFSALKCTACSGPLILNEYLKHETVANFVECFLCKRVCDVREEECLITEANHLYETGVAAADSGDTQKAQEKLEDCLSIRQETLYRSNSDISKCINQLARCYAMQGKFEQSADYLKQSVLMVEEQFGENSIELANELQKLTDVLFCHLEESSLKRSEFITKIEEAERYVKRAKAILEISYGNWTNIMHDVLRKEELLNNLKCSRGK